MTWFIIAYNRKDNFHPSAWQGEGYGEMQKQFNSLYEMGYRNFDVWESDKENVKFKVMKDSMDNS